MASGGLRPEAPQNKFGVSATGGGGSKDGQPIRLAPGGKYGDRKAMAVQQSGAPMANTPLPTAAPPTVHALTGDTGASMGHVTDGVDFGRGGGSEVLPKAFQSDTRNTENSQIIKQYMPALLDGLNAPNVPDSYKRFVNSLLQDSQHG